MSSCCVAGCKSRHSTTRKLKFYRIPTGSRPFQANRRRLWLQAIQSVNGSTEDLKGSARICGAHFISGEASMDHDSPDFVPSVFTCAKQTRAAKKVKRPYGRRKHGRKFHTSNVKMDEETTLTVDPPEVLQSSDLKETDGEPSEEIQEPSTPILPKEGETLSEEDEILNGAKNIKSQNKTTSSLKRTSPSHEAAVAAAIPELGTRRPVILLKPVVARAGGYQCDVCNENFTDVSQFVKHKRQHDEERPLFGDEDMCVSSEISGKHFNSEANFTGQHVHMDEPSFKCNMCDRSFSTSHNLKRHKLLHVKDGRKCRQCGVLFCRRHSHVLFRPQVLPESDSEEGSSADETQAVNDNLTSENGQKGLELNQKTDFAGKTQSTMTTTPLLTSINLIVSPTTPKSGLLSTASMSKTSTIHPIILPQIPDPKLLDPSRPPSPIPIKPNKICPPYHFKPTPLNHPKNFVQPHLPLLPDLPPSLQMFSPQYLTSALLEVKRNYTYIFSKPPTMKVCVKEEPRELPEFTPPQLPQHNEIKKERTAYDLNIVL